MVKKQKQRRSNASPLRKRTRSAHLKASLTYVAPHAHTGKRLHHRHTSHGALFLLLLLLGIIMFMSLAALNAAGITASGNVHVSLTVPGQPPTTGAVIVTPADQSRVQNALLGVTGTCPSGNLVAIYNNGLFSASTVCQTDGTFGITIQLNQGINTLQAQNYDSLNQAGPTTPQINVAYEPDVPPGTVIKPVTNAPGDITIDPSIPDLVAAEPSLQPCYDALPGILSTTTLNLLVPCISRSVFVGQKLELPVNMWGGVAPYALAVDWGDLQETEFFSFASAGTRTLAHTYQSPQLKNVSLQLADATGATYQTRTVVEVNDTGVGSTVPSFDPIGAFTNAAKATWVEASVPVYWAAVALFFGFWVGDLFQRFTGTQRAPKRRRARA